MSVSRRGFLRASGAVLAGMAASGRGRTESAESQFITRGAIVGVQDMATYDWPALAKSAGLTTLATHITPAEVAAFLATEDGQRFLESCRRLDIAVEHELHALGDLLPRSLFDKDSSLFRMDEHGERVREHNLCVHSKAALEVVAENAVNYTRMLPSTTGRYFYWIDDAMPMCRCPDCRGYTDSDQALILENYVLRAIRAVDARATLAHLAYVTTLDPPKSVKPEPGVFLEFAPIERRYDRSIGDRAALGILHDTTHGRLLDALDANLEWFGKDDAQVLEYWLDVSRFAGWKRENTVEIPWNERVFRDDLNVYTSRGIRHVTTFAVWVDADYAERWGVAPVVAYGAGLANPQ